jgi:hypothetical protein
MKSIKPGRGTSAVGVVGGIILVGWGILWTIFTYKFTENFPFPFFHVLFPVCGLFFIGLGVTSVIYNAANATGKNRMSLFDITDGGEESDPADILLRGKRSTSVAAPVQPTRFCPYCGTPLTEVFKFCPGCGKNVIPAS